MDNRTEPYIQAAAVLPQNIRSTACLLDAERQSRAEEFRLRVGQSLRVVIDGREVPLNGPEITGADLRFVLGQASQYSAHMVQQQLSAGYLTVKGGHRIGLCGEAVIKDCKVYTIHSISSMSIRIARQIEGVGAPVIPQITDEEGSMLDTLILSPPGGGKTTLLRDIVRRISGGIGVPQQRVGLADERRELSAMWEGRPQLDVGKCTDIMVDCPKGAAAQILVRGMNPQVLAMDEITAEEDLNALFWAAGCGVRLLATAHGESLLSLRRRPLYRKLLDLKLFQRVVILRQHDGKRSCRVEVIE